MFQEELTSVYEVLGTVRRHLGLTQLRRLYWHLGGEGPTTKNDLAPNAHSTGVRNHSLQWRGGWASSEQAFPAHVATCPPLPRLPPAMAIT